MDFFDELIGKKGYLEENIPEESEIEQNNELMEIVLNTREQCQMVNQLIKNQIEVKDEMINRLHKELDYYKQETDDRFVNQLMKAIIKVRKDMGRVISSDGWKDMDAESIKNQYTYIFEDLLDLLEQQNIDSYKTESGENFDATIHQPKIELTENPELDKKIKQSISEGYKKGDRVLQPERVIVYQYRV